MLEKSFGRGEMGLGFEEQLNIRILEVNKEHHSKA